MIKAFKKISQQIPELQQVINNIVDFVRPLESNPILDYRIIEGVTVGTSATNIPHKLGRPWVGWFVVGRTSAVVPYESTQSNDALFITLIAGSSVTVDLYIF